MLFQSTIFKCFLVMYTLGYVSNGVKPEILS